jgi:hypothetical protein
VIFTFSGCAQVADGPTTAAINALKRSNRTLFFSYMAGGIANATNPADLHDIDASAASALAGMPLQRGAGSRPLFTFVPPSPSLPDGCKMQNARCVLTHPVNSTVCSVFGAPNGAVSPWMFYNATAQLRSSRDRAEVLGISSG